jgi:predicted nucleotidyltransferase
MLTQEEILQYLAENKEFYIKNFGISKIAIFGSFARNEQKETSDIDVLITMDPETDHIFEKRLALRDLLSERFSRKVDVCHEQAIKPVFRNLIFKDVIYA